MRMRMANSRGGAFVLAMFSACLSLCAENTPDLSDAWFQGKDLVEIRYERARWQDPAKFKEVSRLLAPDFKVSVFGNGGKTKNFADCRFRVGGENIRKARGLHEFLVSKGFLFRDGSPLVWAYKVDVEAKAQAERLLGDARGRIMERFTKLLPEFRESEVKGSYAYRVGADKPGWLHLSIDDQTVKVCFDERNCGPNTVVHLPALGFIVQLFAAERHDDGILGSSPNPDLPKVVTEELSEVVRLDEKLQNAKDAPKAP